MYFNKLGTTEYNGRTIPDILKRIVLTGDISASNLVEQYTVIEGETPESLSYNYYGSVDYYWTILLANNIKSRYFDWPMSSLDLGKYIETKYGNKSALFFEEQYLSNVLLSSAKYIRTPNGKAFSVFACDRNLNKLVIEQIETTDLNQNDLVVALDSNKSELFGIPVGRVVYENAQAAHHVVDNLLDEQNRNLPPRAYLNQYIVGQGEEWIVSNNDYEHQENENKRSIFLIKPAVISTFVNKFKEVANS